MVNTFWGICSGVMIVAHRIGEGRSEGGLFGDVFQGLKRVKRNALTPQLWMKSGLKKFLAKCFAIVPVMMKEKSGTMLIEFRFLIHIS